MKALIKNKYFLATVAFMLLLVLNERNSILDQYRYQVELNETRAKHDFYLKEIERLKKEKFELLGDPSKVEKFAREKYFMKRDDETVFIMEKDSLIQK
jgi:cell division protein FtsB